MAFLCQIKIKLIIIISIGRIATLPYGRNATYNNDNNKSNLPDVLYSLPYDNHERSLNHLEIDKEQVEWTLGVG